MKNTQTKFFIMFLAWVLFSILTVFAATISVNTNFDDAVNYLQKIILTDAGGNTWVVLDWANNKIQSDKICETDWSGCKNIEDLLITWAVWPQGPIWPAGPAGPQGVTWAVWPQGPIWPAGPTGPQGVTWAVWPQGPAGADWQDWAGVWSTWASDYIYYTDGNIGIWTNTGSSRLNIGTKVSNESPLSISILSTPVLNIAQDGALTLNHEWTIGKSFRLLTVNGKSTLSGDVEINWDVKINWDMFFTWSIESTANIKAWDLLMPDWKSMAWTSCTDAGAIIFSTDGNILCYCDWSNYKKISDNSNCPTNWL